MQLDHFKVLEVLFQELVNTVVINFMKGILLVND